jgi:transcriptional regulator with XRE-family HTH domain
MAVLGERRVKIQNSRALAGWSQDDLADKSGVSSPTIKRLEAADGELDGRADTGAALIAATGAVRASE